MKIIKNLLKILIKTFIEVYYRIRFLEPVWFYINRKSRNLLHSNLVKLDPIQKRILNDLKASGIAATHLDELFPGKNLLPSLLQYTNSVKGKAETRGKDIKTGKSFLKYLWEVAPIIDIKNPFIFFSLDDRVLGIVNSYLGLYSKFYLLTLNVTLPVGKDSPALKSQRWHRDPEDRKMCKVFLYLTDVDESSGPFMYISASPRELQFGKFFPQRPPLGFYPPDGAVEEAIPEKYYKVMTGRAGTVIFCDTSGLHKGGYATGRERVMFTGGYCSNASGWIERFDFSDNLEAELKRLNFTNAAFYALSPKNTKLASFFWYTYLNLKMKGLSYLAKKGWRYFIFNEDLTSKNEA